MTTLPEAPSPTFPDWVQILEAEVLAAGQVWLWDSGVLGQAEGEAACFKINWLGPLPYLASNIQLLASI